MPTTPVTGREGWPRHPWHDGSRAPIHVARAACQRPYRVYGGPVPPQGWICGDCRTEGHGAGDVTAWRDGHGG